MEAESLLVKINELRQRADNCWYNLFTVIFVFHMVQFISDNIIVYGNNLECYTCMYVLMKSEIRACCITNLRPRDQAALGTSTFNDNFVRSYD